MIRSWFVFLLMLCASLVHAERDTIPYLVRNYTDVDGLPQNSIKAIAMGVEGFAWLTTEDGLVRFDGHQFRNTTASFNLKSNRFGAIIPALYGNDYYATTEKNQYLLISRGKVALDSTVIGSEYRLIDLISQKRRPRNIRNNAGIINFSDTSIYHSRGNATYIVGAGHVALYNGRKLVFNLAFDTDRRDRFFLLGQQLYYLNDNRTLTGFAVSGCFTQSLHGDLAIAANDSDPRVFWNINNPGNIIVYAGKHFYELAYRRDTGFTTTVVSSGFDADKNEIISAYYDRAKKLLLLGSQINGLYVIRPSLFNIRLPENSIGDKVYYAQVALNDSTLLTGQGQEFKMDGSERKAFFPGQLPSDKYSLAIDAAGNIWTKSLRSIFRARPGDFKVMAERKLPDVVGQLYLDSTNVLWIGLQNGDVYTIDNGDSTFTLHFVTHIPASITSFARLAGGETWIGTVSSLYHLPLHSSTPKLVNGSEGKYVRSILILGKRETWITTYGQGFFLVNESGLHAMPPDKNNYLLTSHCILQDTNDFFWITTNKGLFQVAHHDLLRYASGELAEVYYRYFSTVDGLLTNEFNGGCTPCGISFGKGIFSLPTINGLVWFRPAGIPVSASSPAIFIDRMTIDNKDVSDNEELVLPRNLQQMKIFLSVPYWENTDNLQLHYALVRDGDDPNWQVVENNVIALTTIPSGHYSLLIRNQAGNAVDVAPARIVHLRVPSPWILRPWVLLMLAVLLMVLVYFFIRLRTRIVRLRNVLLQKRIQAKTAELQSALDELEISQQELLRQTEWQQKMIAVFSHDIKAPMKYLVMTAERITKGLKEENSSSFIGASSIVHEHIRRLYYIMDNILQYIRTQITENTLQEELFLIYELAEEKFSIYRELARQVNTELVNEIPPSLQVRTNRTLFSVILHNLIDNAVKVTERGRIVIGARQQGDACIIELKDSGIGMHPSLITWINQPANAGKGYSATGYKDMGIGLLMVKDLAALLHLQITATSVAGKTNVAIGELKIE